MRDVRGIEFADSVADAVEQLVKRVEDEVGSSHLFESQKHFGGCLKFALRLPKESHGKKSPKAHKLFAVIQRAGSRAIYHRPLPVKSGTKVLDLTDSTVDEVFRAVMSGYYQARGLKVPVEWEPTENHSVLSGGQFESNRRKH